MTLQEYRQLQAEHSALEKLLAELPDGREIERLGLEARKREIEESLAAQPAPCRDPLRARLTFRGRPIVGSHGIFAEFVAVVVGAFSEAVAALGCSKRRLQPFQKKIKYIDLVFENCESARLEPDMFYALSIRGIQRNYNVNCAQYKNGEYWESTTCEAFYITINEKGLKEAKFNSPQFDKNETLKSRLDKWKDITHVHVYFENKDDEYISVPWKSEEDDRYDTTNKCQSHEYINIENDLSPSSSSLAIEIRNKNDS